ncbi:hypothetical protein MKZ38_007171 [Zalerion maritima]|uniref:Uncharacterized protein n=1 Tax=Zalerion maritima TaxID=339359 RepID=A0AAD5RIR5_9PEZI|nr:hypothetical protein MKZ38_007171 [Zalerion maritima]
MDITNSSFSALIGQPTGDKPGNNESSQGQTTEDTNVPWPTPLPATIREVFIAFVRNVVFRHCGKFNTLSASDKEARLTKCLTGTSVPRSVWDSPAIRIPDLNPSHYSRFSFAKPCNMGAVLVVIGGILQPATCVHSDATPGTTDCPPVFTNGCAVPTPAMSSDTSLRGWIRGSSGACANHMYSARWFECPHAGQQESSERLNTESELRKRQRGNQHGGNNAVSIANAAVSQAGDLDSLPVPVATIAPAGGIAAAPSGGASQGGYMVPPVQGVGQIYPSFPALHQTPGDFLPRYAQQLGDIPVPHAQQLGNHQTLQAQPAGHPSVPVARQYQVLPADQQVGSPAVFTQQFGQLQELPQVTGNFQMPLVQQSGADQMHQNQPSDYFQPGNNDQPATHQPQLSASVQPADAQSPAGVVSAPNHSLGLDEDALAEIRDFLAEYSQSDNHNYWTHEGEGEGTLYPDAKNSEEDGGDNEH